MHCHTRLSKDLLNDPRKLVEVAADHGMDALCVTDHNGLTNALALSKLTDLPIRVIPSEEVKTSEGEIIGYFLSKLVPKGLSLRRLSNALRGKAGLSPSHTHSNSMRVGSRLQTTTLDRLVEKGLVDILEVFNARAAKAADNEKALEYARQHGLAMSGGSDAHTLIEVGRAYAEVPPFTTAKEFLEALRAGTVHGTLSSTLIHLGSTWAKVVKMIPGVAR